MTTAFVTFPKFSYNTYQGSAVNKKPVEVKKKDEPEITGDALVKKKIKRAVSNCFFAAIGVVFVYFGIKRSFRISRQKQHDRTIFEFAGKIFKESDLPKAKKVILDQRV